MQSKHTFLLGRRYTEYKPESQVKEVAIATLSCGLYMLNLKFSYPTLTSENLFMPLKM